MGSCLQEKKQETDLVRNFFIQTPFGRNTTYIYIYIQGKIEIVLGIWQMPQHVCCEGKDSTMRLQNLMLAMLPTPSRLPPQICWLM